MPPLDPQATCSADRRRSAEQARPCADLGKAYRWTSTTVNSSVSRGNLSMVTVATAVGAKSKELGRLYNATYSDSRGAQTMRHILLVAALGILVLIMLAACGGPSGTGSGAKSGEHSSGRGTTVGERTTPEGAATQKTVVIKESEFKLDPSNVTLDKPGTYIFEAKKIGTITHALEIEDN